MPDRRPSRWMPVRDAAAVLVLTAHATAWLAVALLQPSAAAVLTCLAAYGAVLATVALVLSAGPGPRP
ncbi:hypothetical protein ACIRPR_33740 [Streptomyces griseoflavus]|uniref:hypothetical protein n=1 Tax=Streptomyces griseoflavus TaxID=35619 RepID=UPI0038127123